MRWGAHSTYIVFYICPGPDQGCGGELTALSGTFGSVDLDNDGDYELMLNCHWRIVLPDHKVAVISFPTFSLPPPPCDQGDSLTVSLLTST